jgi:xanthine phosphoribosyltransferase
MATDANGALLAGIPAGYHAAVDLRQTVATRSRVDGELVMVDEFLNHRVDTAILAQVGVQMAERFRHFEPDLVLTAEASGIPPAIACASELGLPMVYAKKYLGVGNRYVFAREVTSPTKGVEYRIEVARRVLTPGLRVIVIDDFLSGGRTAEALGEITLEAGCDLLALGFVIEKSWMEGRTRLERHGWTVDALVTITGIENGAAVVAGER